MPSKKQMEGYAKRRGFREKRKELAIVLLKRNLTLREIAGALKMSKDWVLKIKKELSTRK